MGIIMGASAVGCLVGGYFIMLAMLAGKSGWKTLARQYKADGPIDGELWPRTTISVGRLFFRDRAIVRGNNEGVYLSLMPYLRPFHPPLFIPWKDMERRGGHTDQVVFGVGSPPIGEVRIPMEVVEKTQPR